jgi:hypothetical protein
MKPKRLWQGVSFSVSVVLLFYSCKKEPEAIPNQPPLAIAGADRTIALPQDSVHLDGAASTDKDGTIVSYKWEMIGGPQQFIIMSAESAKTVVTRLQEGVYQFQLTTTDNSGALAKDTVQVTVNKAVAGNQSPAARAGGDQQFILPINTFTLDGSASFDPDGTITGWQWTKIAGPVAAGLVTPTAASTLVTGVTTGVYQFELQVTDNLGQSAKDTVQVTVLATGSCNDANVRVVSGPGELTAFGSLSQPRSFVRSAALGDKMIFAGGGINNNYDFTPSNRVDIYNFTTKAWSTAQLSESYYHQHVTVGNKILFVSYGGEIDLYDAVANSWSVLPLTPATELYLPTVAVLGSKVFFAGGFFDDNPTSVVNIYDAAANTWTTTKLSEGRAGMTAVAVGNKLVFAGGYKKVDGDGNVEDPSKRVDIYNNTTNTWSTADLPQPQYYGSAAVVGNKAVFSFEGMNNVIIYDATTNKFSEVSLSLPRQSAKVVSVGNKILVAGGYGAGGEYSRVDIYDASIGSWSVANMSRPGSVAWSAAVGNKLLLSVYNNDGNVNGSVFDVYDAGSNTFTPVQLSHQLFATPVAADGKIYFGGATVNTIGDLYANSSCKVWQFEFK